jgi:hypothetical protein
MTSTLKTVALRARDDFPAMYAAADQVARSKEASSEQIEAAKAARQSIAAVMTKPTDMRMQVARQRFEKLVSIL